MEEFILESWGAGKVIYGENRHGYTWRAFVAAASAANDETLRNVFAKYVRASATLDEQHWNLRRMGGAGLGDARAEITLPYMALQGELGRRGLPLD